MNAVISGRAGVAVLLQDDQLFSLELDKPGELIPRRPDEYHLLIGEGTDLEFLEEVDPTAAWQRLEHAVCREEALDVSVLLLDGELTEAIRTQAAADLEECLAAPGAIDSLEAVLYAAPLPATADLPGALRCAQNQVQSVLPFLRRLEAQQPAIRLTRHAWEALPESLFAGADERRDALTMCLRAGLFRDVARALAESRSPGSHVMQVLDTRPGLDRFRKALTRWGELLSVQSPDARPVVACNQVGGAPGLARLFYFARRRQDLLAPTRTIVEMVDLLSAEKKIGACGPILADLQKIKLHAQGMGAMIQSALDPGRSVDEASKTLNHGLSKCVTPILGYGGDLARVASKYFLDDFTDEFRELDGLGHRVQYLAQATVEQLRSPERHAFVKDVNLYLGRTPAPGAGDDDAIAPSAEPGRILVAEDDEAVGDLLCGYLRSQGHDVVSARDEAEALELLEAGHFDLVMTDIEMPRADGFEVIERLRSGPRWRAIPVIVISGHSELDGIAHCIKMGAEDYLPKPFNRVILKARVDGCLEKKRLRDRSEQERLRYNDLLNAILPGPVVK
jgi:CheY-like chemotaxis protein